MTRWDTRKRKEPTINKSGLMKKIAVLGCFALILALIPLLSVPSGAETWTKKADGGITNPENYVLAPGAVFQDKLTIYSTPFVSILTPINPVSCYTYDGSEFATIGTAGLGNAGNLGLQSTAVYQDELYIGTANGFTGGELYRWDGSGNPEIVPECANGWGEGFTNNTDFPLGVVNNELVVSITNTTGAPNGGVRMYKYDGSTWTQIVGQGTPGTTTGPGLGDSNNTASAFAEVYNGKLVMPVINQTTGLQVWTYDGTNFERIGQPGGGLWSADHQIGTIAVSPLEGVFYMGTWASGGVGGDIWSYDGTSWTQVVGGGMGDTTNLILYPLARGEDLYVSTASVVNGCRVFKREGSSFTPISDARFGGTGALTNASAFITSYDGELLALTGDEDGGEVWSTPIAPSIERITPNSGPYGTTVTIEGHDFLYERGNGTVTFNGQPATNVLSWSDTSIGVIVPPRATTGPVQVTTVDGASNTVDYTVNLSRDWYFAEGSTRNNDTDGTFEEWICLQNPGTTDANTTLTYMYLDGTTDTQDVVVAAESRLTVDVNQAVGADKDVSTKVESDQLILAERPMYFNYQNKWAGGHDVMGLAIPRDTFYFAEGTTRANDIDGYFDEWLCIQNPGSTDAEVTITYMVWSGDNVEKAYTVPATSRRSIKVNDDVGPGQDVSVLLQSTQPIVAERPMYFNYHNKWTGGHDVVGAPGTDTEFYFAEGTTRDNATDGTFEEWLCIQNPGTTDATVTLTYMYTDGTTDTAQVPVTAESRRTVSVAEAVVPDRDVSIKVESDQQILVERPMYFNYQNKWAGGHDVMGLAIPRDTFYFAEGTTRGNTQDGYFDEWLCLQNPGNTDAEVTIIYMVWSGDNVEQTYTVLATSRRSIKVNDDVGAGQDVSVLIRSTQPIVAERPMYFDYHGWCPGGHDALGYGL